MDDKDAGAEDQQQSTAEPSAAERRANSKKEGVEEVVDEEDQEEEPRDAEELETDDPKEDEEDDEESEEEDDEEESEEEDDDEESKEEDDDKESEEEDDDEESEEEDDDEESEEEGKILVDESEKEENEEEEEEVESEAEEQEDVASLSNKEYNDSRTETEETSEDPRSQQGGSLSSRLPWDDHPLLLSVVLLTMKLLKDCNVLQKRSQDVWVDQGHRLINKTMAGMTRSEGLSPDDKDFRKVCHSVVATLEKRFGSKRMLDSVILLEHPEMEAVIVECLQSHIEDKSAWLASGGCGCPGRRLKHWLVALAAVGTSLAAIFLCLYFLL